MIRRYSRPRQLDGGLEDAALAAHDEVERLDDDAFAAAFGQFFPPGGCGGAVVGVEQVDGAVGGGEEQRVALGKPG